MAVATSSRRPSPPAPLPLRWERGAHESTESPPLLPRRERGLGGEGRLCNRKGTRTPVKAIVGYYKLGLSIEEVLEGLPQLTPAQVYEALSYYHDHAAEIERYGLKVTADGRILADEMRNQMRWLQAFK